MTRQEQTAIKLLGDRWDDVKMHFESLGMAQPRPDDRHAIFRIMPSDIAGAIGVEVRPVIFNVPERAHGPANLFVHVRGRLFLDEAEIVANRNLRTMSFGTEVAYFRKTGNELDHVYGAHYDFDLDTIGHPAFHAQFRSFARRHAQVAMAYEMDVTSKDSIGNILDRIRLPVAQMDFFAFVFQLCADHLIEATSGEEQRAAFHALRNASLKIKGCAFRVACLASPVAHQCLRAHHWYSEGPA